MNRGRHIRGGAGLALAHLPGVIFRGARLTTPPLPRLSLRPPREGISVAHFLTVADVERSARYYEKVFGARIQTMGDGNAPPYLQLANIWMILNVGGGPTPDKPTVTLSVPDPNHIHSFMNIRVADIYACYELWKSRGAEFITEPMPKYGEIRCYIRDPYGYIIEVGQSTDLKYG
jgi:predicted enzyme related to lactoylglutathione lyase